MGLQVYDFYAGVVEWEHEPGHVEFYVHVSNSRCVGARLRSSG